MSAKAGEGRRSCRLARAGRRERRTWLASPRSTSKRPMRYAAVHACRTRECVKEATVSLDPLARHTRLHAHTRASACAPAHVYTHARLPWNTLSEHNRASDCLGSAHARQPRAHARQPGHTRALVCLAHTRVCCLGTTGVATATKLSPRCFGPRPRSALNQDLAFNGTWPRCRFTPSLLNHSVSSPRGS